MGYPSATRPSSSVLCNTSSVEANTDEDDGGSSTSAETDQTLQDCPGPRDDAMSEDLTVHLPDDILGVVFRKLDPADAAKCSLVCRRWYIVDGMSRLNLSLKAIAGLGPMLPRVLDRFLSVQKLVMKCDRNLPSIDDASLDTVAVRCRTLRKFKLKNCKQVTDEGMANFADKARELRKFSCGGCGFGIKGLNALLQYCTGLEDLTVKKSVRAAADRGADPPSLSPFPSSSSPLSLRRLCLKDQGSSPVWQPLLEASRKLETLILARNSGQWDGILQASLGKGLMPELSQLYLEQVGVSDRGLAAIGQCPKLEALVVIRAPQCTDAGMAAIAKGCKNLRRLHVEGWAHSQFGNAGLLAIATHCRQLQELVLVGHICTLASIQPLATNCQNLERLTLCSSPTLTDAEIICLSQSCPNLRRLCIKHCHGVTDVGIRSLATGCPSLQRLKIRKCPGVKADSVEFLQRLRPEVNIAQERHRRDLGARPLALEPRGQEDTEVIVLGREQLMMQGDNGGRPRLSRARLALAVGTTYVTGAIRRWVGGNGNGGVGGGVEDDRRST